VRARVSILLIIAVPSVAHAGMPSLDLTDVAALRLRAIFVVGPRPITSEFLWFATASPRNPIREPQRYSRWFFINQAAIIFYTTEGPFRVDRGTCEVPPGALPIGK
jgi:hypothetical protein